MAHPVFPATCKTDAMCAQCMMAAATSAAAATGVRSWLATRRFAWLTPTRLRRITAVLIGGVLIASTTLVSGSA